MIRRIRIWLWLGGLFALCQWLAPAGMTPLDAAQASVAGVSCSATITSVTFGNVDPSYWGLDATFNGNSNLQTTGFLTYYCSNTNAVAKTIDACISIGNPGGATQRSMDGPHNGNLDYQLFLDVNGTQGWGSKYNTPGKWGTPYVRSVPVPAALGGVPGTSPPVTVPIYAQIDASQVSYNSNKTGNYSALYGGGDVAFDTGASGVGCAGASGGGSIGGFMVSANMQKTCQVTTSPMDFGVANGDPSGLTATTTLTVACNFHNGYRVGLDNGKNYQNGSRQLRGGPTHSDYVAYQLYRDSGFNNVWGNTDGTDTQPSNASDSYTVYGRIAANQGMPAGGDYFDAVTVYVYY